jgi:hypothetical protein
MKISPKSVVYSSLAFLAAPSVAFAQARGDVFTNARASLLRAATPIVGGAPGTPAALVGNIINTAIGILGVVALGLILYAGGLWLTAAGNDDKVAEAKKIIRTTTIGIVVVGLAYAITAFIISLVVSA